jgi:uncharacterized membrane protein YoaK (UPF0700 family)
MKPVKDSCCVYGDLGLASLSFASGCTDVLTFLKLGNVFTSAMTGNTALLAIELGRGNTVAASRALTALLAFALGVALATKLKMSSRLKPHTHRGFSRLLLLELIFLTGCAALWSASPDPVEGGRVYAVILLSALSMGIQAVAAGSISSGINTIVFTSALVRIVMSLTGALSRAEEDSQLLAAIGGHLQAFASYGCGALVAATLVWHLPKALIWVPGAAVLFALGASELPGKLQRRRR